MEQEKTPERLRTLDRGLAIVEYLSRNGPTPLSGLRRTTGLANATLLRLLHTLQERGWVRRNIAEGQYELAHSLGDLLGERARAHPLAELATPFLLKMRSRNIGLPSDLCTLIGLGKLEIVESTRMRGPMAPARTGLGIRPSMVRSGHGRATLAFAPPDQARAHLEYLKISGDKTERLWIEDGRLDAELDATRKRGFGLREQGYWITRGFDPGPDLGAMAVPILSSSGLHGTVSVVWLRDDMSMQDVLDLGALPDLQETAARIGAELDRTGTKAPQYALPV
jgi:IclR family mhp operon transcriptional activator